MLKTDFLAAFRTETEWLSVPGIMRRTGETRVDHVHNKVMHCLDRGLIEGRRIEGARYGRRVYRITPKGVVERSRYVELRLDMPRRDTAQQDSNHFMAGHHRRVANWSSILSSIIGKGWVTLGSITEGAANFYKPEGCRKACREMARDGLLEVEKSAIHRRVRVYRATEAAGDFVRAAA